METITLDMLRERAAETARDILEERPVGERLDAIREYVEGWDWNIYNYYIDQLFVLAVQSDDCYIEVVQLNHSLEVEQVKALVAWEYTYDLVYGYLKRMGVEIIC